jgi:F0F1-type ATP synthase alpha subunit
MFFYIHSRLLERASKLRDISDLESNLAIEGGSLTALPKHLIAVVL